jgi:hypothetical protein
MTITRSTKLYAGRWRTCVTLIRTLKKKTCRRCPINSAPRCAVDRAIVREWETHRCCAPHAMLRHMLGYSTASLSADRILAGDFCVFLTKFPPKSSIGCDEVGSLEEGRGVEAVGEKGSAWVCRVANSGHGFACFAAACLCCRPYAVDPPCAIIGCGGPLRRKQNQHDDARSGRAGKGAKGRNRLHPRERAQCVPSQEKTASRGRRQRGAQP